MTEKQHTTSLRKTWRRHRKMKEADNMGLPVPRLEIRYHHMPGEGMGAHYSLVYEHFLGHLAQIPLGLTICGGTRTSEPGYVDLPFREGAHIISDMLELRLPGYLINGATVKSVTLEPGDLPGGVVTKLKRRPCVEA